MEQTPACLSLIVAPSQQCIEARIIPGRRHMHVAGLGPLRLRADHRAGQLTLAGHADYRMSRMCPSCWPATSVYSKNNGKDICCSSHQGETAKRLLTLVVP